MAEPENCSNLVIEVEFVKEEGGGGDDDHQSIKKRKLEGDENKRIFLRKNDIKLVLGAEEQKSDSLDKAEQMINDDLKKMELHEVTENDLIEDSYDMDDNCSLPKFDSLDPAWQSFVGKVKLDVCLKKRQYLGLLKKKKVVLIAVDKIEEIKKERRKSIKLISEKMLSNKEEIEKLLEEIKIKSQLNAQMQVFVKREASKVQNNSKSIEDVGSTFQKIEDEVTSVLEMNESKSGAAERDVVEVNKLEFDNLKEVLSGLVAGSKSYLTCPGCQQLSSPPIYKCPAEHLICNSCYNRKVKTRCPECKLQLDKTGQNGRFKTAEVAWKELKKIEDKLNQ